MKILHVITSMRAGGAEHLLVDLLPRLKKNGVNEVELLLINGEDSLFKDELEKNGVKIHWITISRNYYKPVYITKFAKFFKEHHYDVIHTHNTACQFFVPIAKFLSRINTPLLTTEHSTNNRRRTKFWMKPMDKWMYNRYASIICIADKARENLESHIGEKSTICTINNGVDTKRFFRPIKDITDQKHFMIVMVAGFRFAKDHETLLRAVKLLPDTYRLQLVGDYVQSKEKGAIIKQYCTDLLLDDQVDFLGVRGDVPDVLESSDIIVMSSHWEGLSLSSIEGMSSGRPFIASDVVGLREVVGGAGVLFPHGDEKELARIIQDLCEHPDKYQEVAKRCQERAKQYDISVMAEKYLALYDEILNNKKQ